MFPLTGQAVRSVLINGEPWFLANDVCAVLDITNVGNALARLDDDERDSIRLPDGTPGNPNRAIISEPGLYDLVIRSDKPEAKPFRRWITHDVLPRLRSTGTYTTPAPLADPLAELEQANDRLTRAISIAKAERSRADQAEQRAAELEPKAAAHDAYLSAGKGDRLVRQVAKLLGWRERDLRAFLIEEKLIFAREAQCGRTQYDAYAAHVHHFKPVEEIVKHTWGECPHYTLYLRPSGVDLVARRIERRRASLRQAIDGGEA